MRLNPRPVATRNRPEVALSVAALLTETQSLAFCGLSSADDNQYPPEIKVDSDHVADDPYSLTEVVQHLPTASSGALYATNRFVAKDGTINTAAIRDVDGLEAKTIEQATDSSIEALARHADQPHVSRSPIIKTLSSSLSS